MNRPLSEPTALGAVRAGATQADTRHTQVRATRRPPRFAAIKARYFALRNMWRQIPFLPRRAPLAGTPAMAAIHRMAYRHVVQGLPRDVRLLACALDWICWPVLGFLELVRLEPELRTVAAQEVGRPTILHAAGVWWDCTRLGIPPHEYYHFALYRHTARRRAGDYLFKMQSLDIYERLFRHADAGHLSWVDNKPVFCDILRTHGIATPQTLAVCWSGRVQLLHPLDSPLWCCDLIMKPQKGSNGVGFYRWIRQADGTYSGALGEQLSLDDILHEVGRRSLRRRIIIQQRLVNDAETLRFTGGGLATVRAVTAVLPHGEIDVIACAVKMPVGAAIVDNFMRGNVVAQVDVTTGTMHPGQHYHHRLTSIECHPDTQCQFAGQLVPQWQDIRSSAIRAHELFRTLAIVAFDIAPTENGPVIVEGNARGDLTMIQYPGAPPIGLGPYPEVVRAFLAARGDALAAV